PNFENVVTEARAFLELLRQPDHASVCDSSCYDCLRDYFNSPYHPLLDWRLGRDMLNLLEGAAIDIDDWIALEHRLAKQLATDFGGSYLADLDGGASAVAFAEQLMIVSHPLENQDNSLPRRLALAQADAEDRGFGELEGRPIVFRDSFDLIRRPGWIAAQLT